MADLPSSAPVIVIGGGVMGCSTLYHLAKLGVGDALLVERNKLTSGTTWHSAAQVRALRSTRNLTDLIRYSIELYSALEAETGQQTGWINKGSLSIATNADRMTHIRRQSGLAGLFGVETAEISAGEAKERWPLLNAEDVVGAVWSPDDGRVSPSDLCAALVKGAKARGARIFEDTAVTGILTEGGRVVGIETSRGEIRTEAIALCTGLWSREAGAMAGVDIPVYPCEHFYLLTKPVPGLSGNLPTMTDQDSHLYIRDDSGGILVGCFEPMGKPISPENLGHDFAFQLLPEDWDQFEPMMENALHRVPALETAEVKMLLNGPESFTPDGSFLLGEAAETRGMFLGCGMNSVGVATGGGAGMALAHCIVNGHTPMDLHEADPKRFPGCWNDARVLAERIPEVLGKHYEIAYPNRQWQSARGLRRLPLHARWQAAGAHFGQTAGWERPLYFGKTAEPEPTFGRPDFFDLVGAEVRAATERAAVFDQSAFGKIDVTGAGAAAFLERVCSNRMNRPVGRAVYTLMLNPRGGIESDLTAARLGPDHFRLFVGSAALKRDLAWLRRALHPNEDVTMTDRTEEFAILGLMGPEAARIASALGGAALAGLGYFGVGEAELAGIPVIAARLSYVGEPGWELTCRAEDAPALYDALHGAGAVPAGVLAQSAMRIEKGFRAYGHELDTDVSPRDAGLEFAVDWEKEFIGKAALQARRAKRPGSAVVTVVLDDAEAVPLGSEAVMAAGEVVGKTTSAAFGYRVGKPVALAQIAPGAARDGASVSVNIAGHVAPGRISLAPAFDPKGTRMRQARG